jgi:archaellum component FlaC
MDNLGIYNQDVDLFDLTGEFEGIYDNFQDSNMMLSDESDMVLPDSQFIPEPESPHTYPSSPSDIGFGSSPAPSSQSSDPMNYSQYTDVFNNPHSSFAFGAGAGAGPAHPAGANVYPVSDNGAFSTQLFQNPNIMYHQAHPSDSAMLHWHPAMSSGNEIPAGVVAGQTPLMPKNPSQTRSIAGASRQSRPSDDHVVRRPRKRQRKSLVPLPPPNQILDVINFEDALLELDSYSFEEYIEKASQFRTFTPKEEELVNDMNRKIRNRESARKSRLNKKKTLQSLNAKVDELNEENEHLKKENESLKREVIHLRSQLNSINTQNSFQSVAPSGYNTQSVLLFVFLFTFAILWNIDGSISFLHGTPSIEQASILSKSYFKEMNENEDLLQLDINFENLDSDPLIPTKDPFTLNGRLQPKRCLTCI